MRVTAPNPPQWGPAAHTSKGDNFPIHRIVIHAAVVKCQPGAARGVARYFRSPASGGSAHYVVDPWETGQVVPDHVIAWHAPPNPHSIGVELCYMPTRVPVGFWLLPRGRRLLSEAARLVARLALSMDVPTTRLGVRELRAGRHGITGHAAVSRAFRQSSHWDPGVFPWRRFMRLVRDEAKRLEGGR